MEIITWVGIDHYVAEDERDAFYASLRPGGIVWLMPEPGNPVDKDAVGVFLKYIMRGHISMFETNIVRMMAEQGITLTGRITDDINPEINQVKIVVESVSISDEATDDYPRLQPSVLGIEMIPYTMPEEYSYSLIRQNFDDDVRIIKNSDVQCEKTRVMLTEILEMLNIYLTIWDKSISMEANRLPRYFDRVLTELSDIDTDIRTRLKPMLLELRKRTSLQSKTEQNMKVFTGQMEALESAYSEKDGFYSKYDKVYDGHGETSKRRIEEIDRWLKGLTMPGKPTYDEDFTSFVHMIYRRRYRAQDLYMIITHLLVMRHLAVRLLRLPTDISMESTAVHIHMEGGTFVQRQIINNR